LHQQLNYFQEYSIVKEHVVKNSFFEMSVPERERLLKHVLPIPTMTGGPLFSNKAWKNM
jgi:hypothetical protein